MGLTSTGESFFQLIVVLIIFVGVLVLTYYTTRWIASYQKSRAHGKNLEIIETMPISQSKYVQLIKVGKSSYFLIGVGKDEITSLGRVEEEDLDMAAMESPVGKAGGEGAADPRFRKLLESFRKQLPG